MMIRREFFVILLATLLAVPVFQQAHAMDKANGFIKEVGQKAITSLTEKGISTKDREERFRKIFNKSFNVRLLARFTLGVYWRRATKAQQNEYVNLFEDFVVKAYAARFADYTDEKFNVGDTRDIKGGDKLVASEIVMGDGRTIPVHWRVREKDGHQIVDVLLEGVSMAITQRDEFASIINQNGGKVDGLLIALRKRTGK